MNISVVIPWRDSGDPWRARAWEWVRLRWEELLFPDDELIFGDGGIEGEFNRSAVRNALVKRANHDIMVIADADVVVGGSQLITGLQTIDAGAPWVIPYGEKRYYNLTEEASEGVMQIHPAIEILEPTDRKAWEHKITSWAGILIMRRASFDKVGGYDERFRGWGYEDNAFRAALDHNVGRYERTNSFLLHLWHPAPEEERFGQPHIQENRRLYERYERTGRG